MDVNWKENTETEKRTKNRKTRLYHRLTLLLILFGQPIHETCAHDVNSI